MNLWLVRHAQPLIDAGVCYGASDILADENATLQVARRLAGELPHGLRLITSPLQRCARLAAALQALRPDITFQTDRRLAEMNFGRWELHRWVVNVSIHNCLNVQLYLLGLPYRLTCLPSYSLRPIKKTPR